MIILRQKEYGKVGDLIEKLVGLNDKSFENYKPKPTREIVKSAKEKGKRTGGMILQRIKTRKSPESALVMA